MGDSFIRNIEDRLSYTERHLYKYSYDELVNYVKSAVKNKMNVKHIEKQMPELLKKVLRNEVDESLDRTEKSLSKISYNFLKNDIREAKENEVDVSDVEKQMPELLKKVLRNEVDESLDRTEKSLSKISYNFLKNDIREAKENEVDVSDVEKQMPELLKKVLRNEVDENSADAKENLNKSSYNNLLISIKEAEKGGVNVGDVKEKMPELLKKVLRNEVDESLADAKENLNKSSYNNLLISIKEAEKGGVNVGDVKEKMPELLKKVLRNEVDESLADTKKSLSKVFYDFLVINIREAEEGGVNVDDVEKQMPELLKKVLRNEVDESLADTKKRLCKSSYDVLENSVREAKENKVDVSDVEKQMPELLKKVLRNEVDESLADTKKRLCKSSYDVLENSVREAKENKVDVSDVEKQMPELLKKIEERNK